MKITIGGTKIGDGEPPFVIAEAGCNHNGSLKIAKQLVDSAVLLERKKLSKRTKVTTADTFMLKIFDGLLGVSDTKHLEGLLKGLGKSALSKHIKSF